MDKLVKSLGIDNNLTKVRNKKLKLNNVKDNIPMVEHYNYMADIAFYPNDKFGFKYLLVVVDLANDEFDIEPMKNKNADTTLKAFQKMFERPYIKKPYASFTTDAGTEFKGIFQKYLYDESIYHKTTRVGRHRQLGNIDTLIKQLNRLLIGLMSMDEVKTGKISKAWVKHVPMVREELNKIRIKKLPKNHTTFVYPAISLVDKKGNKIKQEFKINDLVHVLLDTPEDALGNKQTGKMRTGDYRYDRKARKIVNVLYYTGDVTYRYMVEGITNASYSGGELIRSGN